MILNDASQKVVDEYLVALRRQLRDLMKEDMNDIVEEIRTHILDKTTDGTDSAQVEKTLAALGTPEALVASYRTEEMMRRAEAHRSGAQKARIAARWTFVVVAILTLAVISVAGYLLGGVLVVAGVAKLMWPKGTGVWETHNPDGTWGLGLSGGSGNTPPPNAHDIIGWWLLPIGLVLGPAILYGTYRLCKWTLRKLLAPRKPVYAGGEAQTQI